MAVALSVAVTAAARTQKTAATGSRLSLKSKAVLWHMQLERAPLASPPRDHACSFSSLPPKKKKQPGLPPCSGMMKYEKSSPPMIGSPPLETRESPSQRRCALKDAGDRRVSEWVEG